MFGWRWPRFLFIVVLVLGSAAGILGSRDVGKAIAGPTDPTISATADPGGSISPSGDVSVTTGTDQSFTISPDTGYHIADVLVDGGSVGAVAGYTFYAVTDPHTISASFAINKYTITPTAGAHGAITPAAPQSVSYGDTPAFTITPATGYHVADVLVDGGSVGAVTSYTFAPIDADHTISASFLIDAFTLTYAAGPGGSISGASPQTVNYGSAGSPVTALPSLGYHFTGWSDGVLTASRTDTIVTADLTVTATFALDSFTLTYAAGPGGSISGASPQTVNYGSAGSPVTALPSLGYHFTGWSDGVLTADRTDTGVTADLTVTASFAINTYTITPSSRSNGTIAPATPQLVNYGATPTFTITGATGYYIDDVLVDGVSVGPVTSYTFPAVEADHTISASFAFGKQTRISISPAVPVVDYGSSTQLTGALYDSGDPLHEVGMGDQPVMVQTSSSATGPWVNLKTLTTSAVAGSVGACSVSVAPTGPTYYRFRFVARAGSGYGGSISFVVRVGVRPKLGAPKAPKSARVRRSFTVSGTLTPRLPAGQGTVEIEIYRHRGSRWVFARQVPATNAGSGGLGRYGVKVKLTTKGKYRFRAYTVPSATWAGGTSLLSGVLIVR